MILLRSIPMIVMTVIIMVLTKYERVPLIASVADADPADQRGYGGRTAAD